MECHCYQMQIDCYLCWSTISFGRWRVTSGLCDILNNDYNAQNCSNNFPVCSKLTVKFYFCRKSNRKDFIYSFMYYAIYFKTI